MIVKQQEHKRRTFMGVEFLVGVVGERMMVTLMQFKRGRQPGAHSHPHEQVGYCLSGRFELRVGDVVHLVEPGDSYLIPGGTVHAYQVLEDAEAVEVFSPPREEYR
ncbi:MAG: cupin domain-containing protein [Candidatus Bipolaricaulaceae bacterium]